VDRLGRNYEDVTDTIRRFMGMGVVIRTVINNMTFDGATNDPMQEAVRDALIHGRHCSSTGGGDQGSSEGWHCPREGHRQRFPWPQAILQPKPVSDGAEHDQPGRWRVSVAQQTGLTRQTIYRIQADPVAAESALAAWEARPLEAA
jgi:hypothetical protein